MSVSTLSLPLASPEETSTLAERLATALKPGDCVLLDGPIGAGKTHFARHLIQKLLIEPEDVPSPTFTLVQTYDTSIGEIWHADLYRITSLDEIEELGLGDAFETAVCLIEWPGRLAELTPKSALSLRFSPDQTDPDLRHLSASWTDAKWDVLRKEADEFQN